MIDQLLISLIEVSEKAANIARLCRKNKHLFNLLVEEKKNEDANPRFVQDFKTLADVLIQQTVKHDIGNLFPLLRDQIKGEENPKFTNTLGESIIVDIFPTIEETAGRLENVLGGDKLAANLLANEVHAKITTKYTDDVPKINETIDLSNCGIWIDPIDATAEYIKGIKSYSQFSIPSTGLECVTILIGLYDCNTGIPLIGVINQPFIENDNDYESKIFWGCSIGETKVTNVIENTTRDENHLKIAIASPSENKKIIEIVEKMGYSIVYSSGAGHKILKMITGEVDLYLLSHSTTFKWDTCGPHAILNSQNRHLVDLAKSLDLGISTEVSYKEEYGKCNDGGLLAYKNENDFELLKELIK